MNLTVQLSDADVQRIAAAVADPRTVHREMDSPGSVRGMVGHRIRAVLAAHGLRAPELTAPTAPNHGGKP